MRSSITVLSALVAGLLVGGCMAGSDEAGTGTGESREVAGFAQGLTFLEVQPGLSLSAAFVRGPEIIYLQSVRGRPTPQDYQQEPGFPSFEVDARITSADGRLIYLRRGGDDFVDPTWAEDFERQEEMPPAAYSNKVLFGMAAQAATALEAELPKQVGAEIAAQMLPELDGIRDFARSAPTAFAAEELRAIERGKTLVQTEVEYGTPDGMEDSTKYFSAGWYYISVHAKSITFIGGGRHSATRIHKHNGTSWYALYDFCNHGTCAGPLNEWGHNEAMGLQCNIMAINKPTWTALTCSTPYNTWSNSGGHNCHDDTRVQLAAFVHGPSMTRTQFWCNDGDSSCDISGGFEEGGSPACNEGTNKGYNHPNMYRFTESGTNSAQQYTTNFPMRLAQGATYRITTCGNASGDTYLRLFNSSSTQVAANDNDYGCGSNTRASTINYTPPTAGTYTVRAGCFSSGSCSGKLMVTLMTSVAPPTPIPPPPSASCYTSNACGSFTGSCWCDEACVYAGDCCSDGPCAENSLPPGSESLGPCALDNACGAYAYMHDCYCDEACLSAGDCCSDGPC